MSETKEFNKNRGAYLDYCRVSARIVIDHDPAVEKQLQGWLRTHRKPSKLFWPGSDAGERSVNAPWRVHLAYEVVVFVVAVPGRAVAFICANNTHEPLITSDTNFSACTKRAKGEKNTRIKNK
jgi:hypothetical protein